MFDLLINEGSFNLSVFKDNENNRWKFLDDMDPSLGKEAGVLIASPKPIMTLTSLYILFVCVVGPIIMRNREPFHLKTVIRFYNLLMVLLAGVLLIKLYSAIGSISSLFDCNQMFTFEDQNSTNIYRMANFILIVRVSEYLDTIFFTLRKKQNQVTFLHVFHHAFVPMYAYWILRTAPLRFNVFIICINSFIHVLMYFYYFIATFQQSRDPSGKTRQKKQGLIMLIIAKLLMFKKYMTQLQILQFVSLACYSFWTVTQPNRCGIPWTYVIANALLAFGFLGLFLHFYINVYKSNSINISSKEKSN